MSLTLPALQLLPYGVDTWSPDGLAVARQTRSGVRLACPFPCVAIDAGSRTPLRLNNTPLALEGMPDLSQFDGSEAEFMRDYVKRLCRPWDQRAGTLVDRYFETLRAIMQREAAVLAERVKPFAGLYDPQHWLFSAPMPLPRAHVFAPAGAASETLSADDFVLVEFAFWLGPGLVVLLPAQSGLTPRKARERLERLERAGVRVVTYTQSDLAGDATAFFNRALSPRLPAFWEDDPVPMGPFKPAGIED